MGPNELVAANVAELRRRFGMSQRDVVEAMAERAGVKMDPATMARLESGDRRITVADVFAIAIALQVSPLHLLLPRSGRGELAVGEVAVPFREARAWLRAGAPLEEGAEGPFREAELPDLELNRRAEELDLMVPALREAEASHSGGAAAVLDADGEAALEVLAMHRSEAARYRAEALRLEREAADVRAIIEREGW